MLSAVAPSSGDIHAPASAFGMKTGLPVDVPVPPHQVELLRILRTAVPWAEFDVVDTVAGPIKRAEQALEKSAAYARSRR
ncbi:MAG: hypothetical protein ACRD2U_06905 [Terriglobales bacterium]